MEPGTLISLTVVVPVLVAFAVELWAWQFVPPKGPDPESLLDRYDLFASGRRLREAGLLRELRIYRVVRYVVVPALLVVGLTLTILRQVAVSGSSVGAGDPKQECHGQVRTQLRGSQ